MKGLRREIKRIAAVAMAVLVAGTTIPVHAVSCQTAHCGRHKLHFAFGSNTFPIVPYRHSPQALCGLTADCRSFV